MNRNTSNIGMDDQNVLIQNLNNAKVIENIGGIVFVGLLMIVGIPGNTVALYVYLQKYKPSTYRIFIVCRAIVDLATCGVTMPFFLVVLIYPITFPDGEICRIFYFVSYSLWLGSSLILITIELERYRKICIPHGIQFSVRMSQYIYILDLIVACCFSWPAIVMYGNKSYQTGSNRTSGTQCTVNDNFADTNYPTYFNFVLLLVFFASFISLTIIYIPIGKQILRMKSGSFKRNQQQKFLPDEKVRTQTNEFTCSKALGKDEIIKTTEEENIKQESGTMSFTLRKDKRCEALDGNINTKSRSDQRNIDKGNGGKQRQNTITITLTLFIITAVFICSFLPHLALRITAFLNKNFLQSLSFSGIAAYQTFRWTFLINSMANPIIYGFTDSKFLREVSTIYRSFPNNCLNRK